MSGLPSPSRKQDSQPRVIVAVDLDGTLVRTDLFFESLLVVFLRNPKLILAAFRTYLSGGRPSLKEFVAHEANIDPKHLPYDEELLDYLRARRRKGDEIWLVTAADRIHATGVANHLNLFSKVLSSRPGNNLKGENKVKEIRAECPSNASITYIGDSIADRKVWRAVDEGFVVGHSGMLAKWVAQKNKATILGQNRSTFFNLRCYFRLLRPHQWVKNLLVFIPIIASHRFFELTLNLKTIIMFASLSLAASFGYVVNDFLDINNDRAHKNKRHRPLAAGAVPFSGALVLGFLCISSGLLIAYRLLGPLACASVAVYTILSLSYTMVFKRMVLVDTLFLAGLYTLRILSGSVVTEIAPSDWLLGFSTFIFLSLAFVKRASELREKKQEAISAIKGRGYIAEDFAIVNAFGVSSGLISVVVLLLYVHSPDVQKLYAHPQRLFLVTPFLIYWIGKLWFLANRGQIHHDPVVHAIKSKDSMIVMVAMLMIAWLAS